MYRAIEPVDLPTPRPAALPERCTDCAGRASAICASLSATALRELAEMGRARRLATGATLMWEGEPAAFVGTVRQGMFKLTASLDDGREQILGIAGPGDFVGQPLDAPASHCLTALGETSVCLFPRDAFRGFAARRAEVGQALLARLFGELDRARRWMLLLGRKNAGERVASFLLELAERDGTAIGAPIPLPLTRQHMAGLLGLTIETVSRRLHQFADDGVIALPDLRHFTVLDQGALVALAG